MNYDPLKFCRHGGAGQGHMAPRDSFRWLPLEKGGKRMVCESCYQKVMAERERIKRERVQCS